MIGESMLITKTMPGRPQRWMTAAASLFFHSFFIAALIIAPLMDADAGMPSLTIEHIFLSSPPPPAPPPPPRGGDGSDQTIRAHQNQPAPAPPKQILSSDRLIVPPVVPDVIPEEDLAIDIGSPGSSGIIGAVTSWEDADTPIDMSTITGKNDNLRREMVTTVRGATITPPRLLRRIAPEYPPLALKARIEGRVTIQAETDVYGKVTRCVAASGHQLLISAAEEAVRKWIYEPYIINGIPRPVKFIVEVNFTLNRR